MFNIEGQLGKYYIKYYKDGWIMQHLPSIAAELDMDKQILYNLFIEHKAFSNDNKSYLYFHYKQNAKNLIKILESIEILNKLTG